ncbi:MAG TPA: transglycosylase SLT domain-containing protein [Polyangia bacterium]|nr:transglycosylase SLT domain-containing protein [Polyangia bacterium]
MCPSVGLFLLAVTVARAGPATASPVQELGRGYRSYRAGDYKNAIAALGPLVGGGLRNDDWALYLLAESEFYQGDYPTARRHFERLAAQKSSGRPREIAAWRVADCLWMAGERAAAGTAYGKLSKHGGPFNDVAVARFRLAELASARNPTEGAKLFLAVHREFPAHPLADEALRRAAPPRSAAVPELPAPERLKRAEALSKDRHWNEALEDLAKLPAELPGTLGAERDYQIGMTKYHMRRDYPRAAELLLAAAPLLTGDRAASAAFHGARALSRVDRDDEAIVGYHKVIATFPRSRYAAEAQYLAGWLEFNRGRFRESLPDLQATLDHFGKSDFADDAAWCLAFAHYQLGEMDRALAGFERYERSAAADSSAEERRARVTYWRARIYEKTGRKPDAVAGYRDSLRRGPLSFYGLLAGARLRALGESVPPTPFQAGPPAESDKAGDGAFVLPAPAGRDGGNGEPALARADELLDAGMDVEAGWELERNETVLLRHLGEGKGLATLLDRYRRASDFARAYRLAESRAGRALGQEPKGGARVIWEAAFPKAYSPLVDTLGPAAGNPDWFLYAIMRKESGFSTADVSYADARGLLQMIPATSAKVAAAAGLPFAPDQLYEPETNIRLGAAYIGSLYRKFGQQIPVAAGSYNAGPRSMARWCDQHGKHPMDEFVELIAYAQTREYVKRVVAIYARYRYLYGPSPYEIPLTVDAKYRADGPDY